MDINNYLMSPIPEVKDLAERAVKIETMFNNGEITQDEYQELATDLLELKYINQTMVNLEITRELWQIAEVLKNLKFFASLI